MAASRGHRTLTQVDYAALEEGLLQDVTLLGVQNGQNVEGTIKEADLMTALAVAKADNNKLHKDIELKD